MTYQSGGEGPRGLSAMAIAYSGAEPNHPHDPADLLRCVNYCRAYGVDHAELTKRMTDRSPEWNALLPEWEWLTRLLASEMEHGDGDRAPITFREMQRILKEARS
jgi:hypothetical protein